ncbi:hypothetical protein, partial [Chitiniphilus shinanonensis]|uniref:hypothetical protein n=1 Tax=Chitiniphilus shinanonensis TaxID=553088 RepID=UPI00058D5CAD
AGQVITLPNRVSNYYNSSATFRPYSAERIIGDLSPKLPDPPPPPKSKCGGLGQIIMVVVAIVVTVYTAGAASGMIGAAMTSGSAGAMGTVGAGLAASSAASSFGALAVGGMVGGAMGSLASQMVGVAFGLQDGISWKGVAQGALSGMISYGIGGAAGSGTGIASRLGITGNTAQAITNSMIANAATQGVNIALGQQGSFSWTQLALAGVTAGSAPDMTSWNTMPRLAGQFGVQALSGLAGRELDQARGKQVGKASDVLLGAVGGAIGNTLTAPRSQTSTIAGSDAADPAPKVDGYTLTDGTGEQVGAGGLTEAQRMAMDLGYGPLNAEAAAAKLALLDSREAFGNGFNPILADGMNPDFDKPTPVAPAARRKTPAPASTLTKQRQILAAMEKQTLLGMMRDGLLGSAASKGLQIKRGLADLANSISDAVNSDSSLRATPSRSAQLVNDFQAALSGSPEAWSYVGRDLKEGAYELFFPNGAAMERERVQATTAGLVKGAMKQAWNTTIDLAGTGGVAGLLGLLDPIKFDVAGADLYGAHVFDKATLVFGGLEGLAKAGGTLAARFGAQSLRATLEAVPKSSTFYKVESGGVRGELSLNQGQRQQIQSYLSNFDMNGVEIRWVDDTNLSTGYGDMFGQRTLNIGSDVVPGNVGFGTATANSRVSINGTLAHELVGHMEAGMAGKTQNILALEEAQASIRAARFAPDLTSTERYTLLRDGIMRLKNAPGGPIKIRDVKDSLYIWNR